MGAEYKDVREETTFETEVNEIVEKWLRGYDGLKDTHRYFLVRDAYLAGHMNYIFTKRDIEDLGGEAKFKRLFVVKGTVAHHQHENSYQLDQELRPPLRVCIRASELLKARGADGAERYHVLNEVGQVPPITRSLD